MSAGERVRHFFFAAATPINLAVCRIIFYLWLFGYFLSYDLAEWSRYPADAWRPVWYVGLFGPLPSPAVLAALGAVWKASLLFAAAGLWRHLSCGVAALLGAYALGLTGSFSKDNYDVGVPVILLAVFWVARSTDALSLDAVIARRRGRSRPAPSGEYTWPLSLGRVLIAIAFFTAGMAKLRHSGLDWATTDSLQWLFIGQQYTHEPPVAWGATLATLPWLCRIIAGATIALEISYPLALLSARLRPWIVIGVISLQLGIHLLMGVSYLAFLVANVVWVDWVALGNWLQGRVGALSRRVPASSRAQLS